MTARKIWFKLTDPQETDWTQVSLTNVINVDDLKKAIKNEKPIDLKDMTPTNLLLVLRKKMKKRKC